MPIAILDGLGSVDTLGRIILATTFLSLLTAIAVHVWLRARYRAIARDLESNADPSPRFTHRPLNRIVEQAMDSARRSEDPNTQAIIEDTFQSDLKPLLLGERFVRASTGLVLVLGLLGTFYGLTLSIGRLVHLVTADTGAVPNVTQAVTHGLMQALTGMAVAFSNSLVGIASAVALTLVGVFNNVTDLRTALMIQIETYLDRILPHAPVRARGESSATAGFGEAVMRLEGAVVRFESALNRFSADTKNLREVQLVVALKPGDGR